MNINATLIGQAIAFLLFIGFCMKYVWPPIMQALDERKKKIADGLAAAERGRHEQELAEKRAQQVIHEAKEQANEIVAQATKRGNQIVDESKDNARVEGERILTAAKAEIDQEANRARDELKLQVGSIALAGASKIVGREIDEKAHTDLLDELVSQI
ncbi:F0F1 ATP synthase subunit B [Methylophaga sulfidovorans]|jgi:F-type H+-transporting ATPase subunit b|uniref:ATP synthase subunit b n=1 Tax=Methylophaga sulfidovorans TaxID=45496 RepID=A0A1I3W629_9GAMM|nr:F0F1 ATP synthase subunit B [Methylophaga sulfidovorans]SFK02935.1 ATP synthase F0 subcomplex B subunit [Methylophaga sulfidovorans]